MPTRQDILSLSHYNIIFTSGGQTTGYWFVYDRIGCDAEAKAAQRTLSKGYEEQIIKLNKLHQLYEVIANKGVAIDALLAQYEAALILQYIANNILKEFTVSIICDWHKEENELQNTPEDEAKNSKMPTLVTVPPKSEPKMVVFNSPKKGQ